MPASRNVDYIVSRIDELREQHEENLPDRIKIRNIMNGGNGAIREILGEKALAAHVAGSPIPMPPLMIKGLERLAQKISEAPKVTVRADSDKASAKRHADRRERIVQGFDILSGMERQLPYISRWVPGYGFGVWVIKHGRTPDGTLYPHAQLRNPFNCYPGEFGPDLEPTELAVLRRTSISKLQRIYNGQQVLTAGVDTRDWQGGGLPYIGSMPSTWDGPAGTDSTDYAEYYDESGSYVIHMDSRTILSYLPNPISTPPFVVERRVTFDQLGGAYNHLVGLLSMLGQINLLSLMNMKDGIMRETNIIGADGLRANYQRGRGKVNYLPPGARVETPQNNLPYQVFQLANDVEGQLRQGASYPVTDDGSSSVGFATGEGLKQLGSGIALEIEEYQIFRKHSLQLLDAKRLEWDEKCYPGIKKNLKIQDLSIKYEAGKEIRGHYNTTRKFGLFAGLDKPQKAVVALQLLQGGIVDTETVQENTDGLDHLPLVQKRLKQDRMEATLMAALEMRIQQQDPAALAAVVEMYVKPDQMETILQKYFTPAEPELSPEEQAFVASGGGPGNAALGGPPDVTTLLAQLQSGAEGGEGNASIGSQTVGVL